MISLVLALMATASDAPFFEKMALVTPAGHKVHLTLMCGKRRDGKVNCEFTETQIARNADSGRCVISALAWTAVEFERVNDTLWASNGTKYMHKVGCDFVQTLYLSEASRPTVSSIRFWTLKQSREYSWSAAACRKFNSNPTFCSAIQRECEMAKARLSTVLYSGDRVLLDDFKLECSTFVFDVSHWSSAEVPDQLSR